MFQYKKADIKRANSNPTDKTRGGFPIYKQSFKFHNGLEVYITIVGKNEKFKTKHLQQINSDLWYYLRDRIGIYCKLWDVPI